MQSFTPLHDIVATLADLPPGDIGDPHALGEVLKRNAEPLAEICAGLHAPDGRYLRSLLYRTDRFELLLLQWGRDAASGVHDHAGQSCVFTVLSGSLEIDDYEIDSSRQSVGFVPVRTRSGTVGPGALDYRKGEADVHRVRCAESALSLHVYAEPVEHCAIYCPQTYTREFKKLAYDDIRVDLLRPFAQNGFVR